MREILVNLTIKNSLVIGYLTSDELCYFKKNYKLVGSVLRSSLYTGVTFRTVS